MKKIYHLFLIILFPSLLFGQSSIDTKVRLKTKFNSDWKFMQDDKAGFESPAFNDSTWRSLDLPHDWSVEGKFDSKIRLAVRVHTCPAELAGTGSCL